MVTGFEKRQKRQFDYQNRARRARLYARLMIPVAAVCFASALWSDPALGPQLAGGLDELQPLLATVFDETPLENVFASPSDALGNTTTTITSEEAALALPSDVPASVTPVNRP